MQAYRPGQRNDGPLCSIPKAGTFCRDQVPAGRTYHSACSVHLAKKPSSSQMRSQRSVSPLASAALLSILAQEPVRTYISSRRGFTVHHSALAEVDEMSTYANHYTSVFASDKSESEVLAVAGRS